jgi:Xaa-Pro aminopeptidase
MKPSIAGRSVLLLSTVATFALACAASPADDGTSAPAQRCGLGAEFHAGRRAALATKLEKGLLLVRGLPPTRDYEAFRQDKTFWYLTGIESPGATLLVDIATKREVLFLPAPDRMGEIWEGELWDAGDAWVPKLTGIADVRPAKELAAVLAEWTAKEKRVWIDKEPYLALSGCQDRARPYDERQAKDPLDGRPSREQALEAKLVATYGVEVQDCAPALTELRLVKTTPEIDAMRRAGHAGALAIAEAIRSTGPGLGEGDLEALMTFVQRRSGADGPAYQAIVGSGPNALALHYSALSRTLEPAEIVLVDYAPEYDHYTSDITRSWPTDGVFTPRMAELYDAVLAAQLAGIAAVKPGGTIRDVEKACRKVLEERGLAKLTLHGTCHYIGLEVHDVGDLRKPLEPGVAFTVEPGLYDSKAKIGVRIEDVVVVTPDGCEVLTRDVPKEREAIRALFAEEGWLDRTAAKPVSAGAPAPGR